VTGYVLLHCKCMVKSDKRKARIMVEKGKTAPDFELPGDDGKSVRLSKLKGGIVVLYFYPKDDTSGCTREAKDFTELAPRFKKAGAEVFGISPDSVASHDKFRCKHDLSVRLLSDDEKKVAVTHRFPALPFPGPRSQSRGSLRSALLFQCGPVTKLSEYAGLMRRFPTNRAAPRSGSF